jgi:hypothetical protein
MNDTLTKELLGRLDVVAAKIGVGAERLWGFLLKDAFVSGVQAYVIGAVLLVIGLLALKAGRSADADNREDDGICFYMLGVVLMFLSVVMFVVWVGNFLNPEYVAFKTLMGLLK